MKGNRRLGAAAALLAGIVAAFALAPSLVGCVDQDESLRRFVAAFRGAHYALSDEARAEVDRFKAVYDVYADNPSDSRAMRQFEDAFMRVRADYLRPVPDSTLIDSAIEGVREANPPLKPGETPSMAVVEAGLHAMVASLDPHSTYLDAEALRETYESTSGEFGGLGIEITMFDGVVKIVSPIEGTPAYRVGLASGDLITHLDGQPVRGKTIQQAVKIMRGKPGTDIVLTVRRGDLRTFDVTVTRAVISVEAVRSWVDGDFGYVRIAAFNEHTEDELVRAMQRIEQKHGAGLRGIVIDLRNNPGGLLDQAVAVADSFIEQGRLVSIRGRNPSDEQVFRATRGDIAKGLPIVVLVNGGSASASEIVAGALQDSGRAVLMGTRTFGKGSVQTISPLPIEGAVKLTTALYYVPSGRTIQALGVTPDIAITGGEPARLQHEADLPGSLAAQSHADSGPRASVARESCPVISVRQKDDRTLGCAIKYLEEGSREKFLAAVTHGS